MAAALTAKGQATRARIVHGAADVVREKGVTAVTLDDVMARTRTSRSQLFHYFPGGKDQLLLAVAEYEAEQVLEDQQPYLGCLDSWEAWEQWRDAVVRRYEEQGDHCPLGTLFSEVGRSTPGARAVVVTLIDRWQASLAEGIRAMQQGGHLVDSVDPEETAAALLAAVQGGVSILLSTGRSAHLRTALDWGLGRLRAEARA